MFEKKSLFLIIFGVAVLVLGIWAIKAPSAEAWVYFGCVKDDTNPDDTADHCGWEDTDNSTLFCESTEWCMINPFIAPSNSFPVFNSCTDTTNGRYCRQDFCSAVASENGAPCTVIKGVGGVLGGCSGNYKENGVWDATGFNCVQCDSISHKIDKIIGSSVDLNFLDVLPADEYFLRICGADTACDTKKENQLCVTGFACESRSDTCVAGEICSATGLCATASDALVLTVSANPLTIIVNGTSTITFTVTKNAVLVNGATVENITVTGGFVSATSCVTAGVGTCAVTYTAPPIAGLYGVNAAKATKLGETDSASAGVVITVLSSAIAPCGPEIGVLCNPVDNASDFYDVIVIAIRYLLSLIALITLLFIVISGIKYLTSFGNEEKMRSAKEGLSSAVFGLVLVLMAFVILEAIIKILSS